MTGSGVILGELVQAAGARLVHGDLSLTIRNIEYDSRKIEPGDLFVALRGGYADGHDYMNDALQRGAVAALVEDPEDASEFPACAIVNNTREALSPLSARFFGYPGESLGMIGVTGTDGKTTTSYLIDQMLREEGFRTGLVGTISIRIVDQIVEHESRQTTPESLEIQRLLSRMRDARVDWTVLEATSHALALYRLHDCPFDIGVITNVTREHLDFHGSVEAYRLAKAQLLRKVENAGERRYPRFAVVNLDDSGAREIGASSSVPVFWFSARDPSADLFASEIESHPGGTRFRLKMDEREIDVSLKLIGDYNVFNAMAAAGVGFGIGLSPDDVRAGLEALEHVPGRMQRVDAGQPFGVIVDYAHSPASLEEALKLVRNITRGRVIAVSGSAGERDRGKRPVQGRISADLADLSIFTSEDPRFEDPELIVQEVAQGAASAGYIEGCDYWRIENRREAINFAIEQARPDDTILLAGKGHETCIIYGDERMSWDEAGEAKSSLRRHGYNGTTADAEGIE